jgi:hypothetical protein
VLVYYKEILVISTLGAMLIIIASSLGHKKDTESI